MGIFKWEEAAYQQSTQALGHKAGGCMNMHETVLWHIFQHMTMLASSGILCARLARQSSFSLFYCLFSTDRQGKERNTFGKATKIWGLHTALRIAAESADYRNTATSNRHLTRALASSPNETCQSPCSRSIESTTLDCLISLGLSTTTSQDARVAGLLACLLAHMLACSPLLYSAMT
ncbi:hypothetical protein F5Y15DRAFT_144374 [Xylariaceae sp. FL0016]|nr:hypothetical protein F5Y15DRAFT_144374 [Xylariaceae sp. FL0016]